MKKNSTGAKRRHGRIRTETAQILAFPRRAIEAHAGELDHITITLQADGTHNVRMVGRYAEATDVAIEALGLVLSHVTPLAVVARAGQVINFPARRIA